MERAGTAAGPAGKPWVGEVFWHTHKITHSYGSVSERHVFKHTHTESHEKQSLHVQVRDTDVTYCKHVHLLYMHYICMHSLGRYSYQKPLPVYSRYTRSSQGVKPMKSPLLASSSNRN